ncbi:MAG: AzlD domain-containing protein [Actinomycetaceae bacterium]|nr:AzlD domain-containing protein [Actinomycetaceae bacterium]
MTTTYIVSALIVIAVVTYMLRASAFVALRKVADRPVVVETGRVMPIGVMIILVAYTLTDVTFSSPGGWIPSAAGMLVTFVLHVKWSNSLVSIVAGIATYATLLHVLV